MAALIHKIWISIKPKLRILALFDTSLWDLVRGICALIEPLYVLVYILMSCFSECFASFIVLLLYYIYTHLLFLWGKTNINWMSCNDNIFILLLSKVRFRN